MKTKEQNKKIWKHSLNSLRTPRRQCLLAFKGMTVPKDQELRNQLREAGVSYGVVKNTWLEGCRRHCARAGRGSVQGRDCCCSE